MPVVSITLLPGYSAQAEERLVSRVARAVRSVIDAPAAGTTVFVHHAYTYQRDGRVMRKGGAECADAGSLVRAFLDHMQARDLAAAAKLLAPGFVMQFPGTGPMHRLEQVVEWARGRYRTIAKAYEHVNESWTEDGSVVYCMGTLHGVWLDGSAFAGVRFVDRFEVVDGAIRRQDVYNDLAEHAGAGKPPS